MAQLRPFCCVKAEQLMFATGNDGNLHRLFFAAVISIAGSASSHSHRAA
jgi:hypothetical protein